MAETTKKTATKAEEKKTTTAKKTSTASKPTAVKKEETKVEPAKEVKVAETKKKPVKAEKKTAEKLLTIRLVKSPNGRREKQKRTLIALGLRKLGDETKKPDNAQIRGMLFVVKHLVDVKEN